MDGDGSVMRDSARKSAVFRAGAGSVAGRDIDDNYDDFDDRR